jgi:hypothetical protein
MTTATLGAGFVDSYAGLVGSITSDSESEGMQALDVSINATGAVVDTVATLADPLGAVLNAGVGWLL